MPVEVAEVADRLGVDLTAHRSRQLDPDEVATAALVVGLAREHVREVSLAVTGAFPRTFTLRELVRRAGAVGGRRGDEPLGEWVERLGDGRRPSDLLGSSPDDDVADPYGGPPRAYAEMAATLDALIRPLAPALAGR